MSDFEQFYVDHQNPEAVEAPLRNRGIATFAGVTDRARLTDFASQIMTSREHRDADVDHITSIRPDGNLVQRSAGAGFSRAAVPPHTEGSSLPNPPRLLLLACVSPAPVGGTTVVIDGAALHRYLYAHDPQAAEILSQPEAVEFGTPALPSAPFECLASDRVTIRYRDDDLVEVAPDARRAWESLRAALLEHQIRFKLSAGQGLVLNNTRWLHGRDAFEGDRLFNRIVGDPRAGLRIPIGFDSTEMQASIGIGL